MLRVLCGYIDTFAYFQFLMRWTKGVSVPVLKDRLPYVEPGPAYFDRIGWRRIVHLWARGAAAELALSFVGSSWLAWMAGVPWLAPPLPRYRRDLVAWYAAISLIPLGFLLQLLGTLLSP
jgi:hypothetical protein